ncbi:hypothetical protein [uncultured Roseovarius sp.]|mgnify:CR=1 FL=1|uniref:hypothetical protein n=1 Tax=uncultured Roseovarius sp. TaxID=293344 RepID=UPI0025FE80A4|nr:hypothetical protein [uncultured Roseovarius sp.]
MTFRKFAMATAISSATAVAAFADDQGMSGDHGDIAAGTSVFSEMGVEYDMDGRSAMNIDMVDIDDAGVSSDVSDKPDTSRAADTSPENILAVAKEDAEIWTSDNAAIGTAFKTEEYAEGSHLVYVDVAADAKLPVDVVAFPVDALRVANEGVRLEHTADLAPLREAIQDRIEG